MKTTVWWTALGIVVTLATAARAAEPPTASAWHAASGLSPEQICPPWTLADTAPVKVTKQTAK